mmetsp:Transcript_20345/g.82139  ORF Transcript_20345/g.82139 Transcript_20345/m.82139 type:complete len:212 (-) Transcript_20345:3120-3755(-)
MSDSKSLASRWRRIEKGFVVKFELAELPYRVVATDFGAVFTCDVDRAGFRQQRESHYPGEESVSDHDVLMEVQSLVDRADPRIEQVDNGNETTKMNLRFTAEMDGIQFEWVFVLKPASLELSQVVVRDMLVQPLLDVQSALMNQRDKLFRLLLAKDSEILAYKSVGGAVQCNRSTSERPKRAVASACLGFVSGDGEKWALSNTTIAHNGSL